MASKPLLDIETVNPLLFSHVEELRDTREIRRLVFRMKGYLGTCRLAADDETLAEFRPWQYFLETQNVYSMKDLTVRVLS